MFDINAKLGHWPYRPVKGLKDLLLAMDTYGVERAAVSSLSAVHFLNSQDGNDELAQLIAPHRDRLDFFAVLRPNFTGCIDDMNRCANDYAAKGIVLHPNYHEFDLAAPEIAPVMYEAVRLHLPVCIQSCLEDVRRQFRPYKTEDVPADAIGKFARAYPDATVIVLGLNFGQPEAMGDPLPTNLFFDTSNYETMGDLEFAVEKFGADKILFGTNFPLFNPRANVDKINKALICDNDKKSISCLNVGKILW